VLSALASKFRGMAAQLQQEREASQDQKQWVYLVTIPRPNLPWTREQVSTALRDAFNNPLRDGAQAQVVQPNGPVVQKAVTALELHADGLPHFHVAIRFRGPQRWLSAKKTLKGRYDLDSHFSDSHSQFWSALRYLTTTTEHKSEVDTEPHQWTLNGRILDLFEESQEPWSAQLRKRNREEKDSKDDIKKGRFTKSDLIDIIIAKQLKTKSTIMAYAQDSGTKAMQAFVVNQQRKLVEFLHDAKDWEEARDKAKHENTSSWDLLLAAAHGTCEQGDACEYAVAVKETCSRKENKFAFSLPALAVALRKIIQEGPSKTARVPLLVGPTNSGKSTLVIPFDKLYGPEVFHKPALGSKFALRNLVSGKRFLFWDDYRPVEYGQECVPVSTFLSCFDGAAFEIQCSQSFNDGNIDFTFKGGAVMTGKEKDLWDPKGCVSDEDVRHMQSRVQMFRIAGKPKKLGKVLPCACHMARWIVESAAASDAAIVLQPPPVRRNTDDGEVEDWEAFVTAARLDQDDSASIFTELREIGAASVKELLEDDWLQLQSLQSLRPLVQRRVLALVRDMA